MEWGEIVLLVVGAELHAQATHTQHSNTATATTILPSHTPAPKRKGVNKRVLSPNSQTATHDPKPNPLTTTTSIVRPLSPISTLLLSRIPPPPTSNLHLIAPEYSPHSPATLPEIYSHGPAPHYEAGCRLRQTARCVVRPNPSPPPPPLKSQIESC